MYMVHNQIFEYWTSLWPARLVPSMRGYASLHQMDLPLAPKLRTQLAHLVLLTQWRNCIPHRGCVRMSACGWRVGGMCPNAGMCIFLHCIDVGLLLSFNLLLFLLAERLSGSMSRCISMLCGANNLLLALDFLLSRSLDNLWSQSHSWVFRCKFPMDALIHFGCFHASLNSWTYKALTIPSSSHCFSISKHLEKTLSHPLPLPICPNTWKSNRREE